MKRKQSDAKLQRREESQELLYPKYQEHVEYSSDYEQLVMNRSSMASASSYCFNHDSNKMSPQNMQSNDAFPIGNVSYNDPNRSVLEDKDSSFVLDCGSSDLAVDPSDYIGLQQKQVEDLELKRNEEDYFPPYVFVRAIQESVQSTQWLQTLDRNMGLKKCHSRTMTNSTNSRKKLQCIFQIKEKEANDDNQPLRIFPSAA